MFNSLWITISVTSEAIRQVKIIGELLNEVPP